MSDECTQSLNLQEWLGEETLQKDCFATKGIGVCGMVILG